MDENTVRTNVFKSLDEFQKRKKSTPRDVCRCQQCKAKDVEWYVTEVKREANMPAVAREQLELIRSNSPDKAFVVAKRIRGVCQGCSCETVSFAAYVSVPVGEVRFSREYSL